jgi:hypothetical protein
VGVAVDNGVGVFVIVDVCVCAGVFVDVGVIVGVDVIVVVGVIVSAGSKDRLQALMANGRIKRCAICFRKPQWIYFMLNPFLRVI